MPKVVDHEERRRTISVAACRVIANAGLSNTTVRDIAAEAGCTTGMVVHYFAGKKEVLLAALNAASSAVAERMIRLANQSTDPYEALCQCLPMDQTRLVEWRVWIAFWDNAIHDPDLAREQRERYRSWYAALQLTLMAAGYSAGPALERAAESLMVIIDGIGMQAVFDAERFPPDRQLQQLRYQSAHLFAELDVERAS